MSKVVLIVDDDIDTLELSRLSLEVFSGWSVRLAANGPDALNEAQRHQPDLILLDYCMPGMSGLDLFRTLKKTPSLDSIPVIFYTAHPRELELQSDAEQAVAVLGKPLSPQKLSSEVQRLCPSR